MGGKKYKIGTARQSFAFCFILVIIEHKGWHATNPLIISLLIEFNRVAVVKSHITCFSIHN